MSKFNIELYDSEGNMRNVNTILTELSHGWKSYTQVQKNAIASAVAGVRQYENFIVLMNNFGKAQDYTKTAIDSSGTAMEKFGAYTEGVEAKINIFKSTFEEFSQNLLNSDLIGKLVDIGTGLLKIADNLKLVQIAFIALIGVGVVKGLTALGAKLNKLSNSAQNFITLNKAMGASFKGFNVSVQQAKANLLALALQTEITGINFANMSKQQVVSTIINANAINAFKGLTKAEIEETLASMGVVEADKAEVAAAIQNILARQGQTVSIKALTQATWLHIKAMTKEIATMVVAHPIMSAMVVVIGALIAGLIYAAGAEERLAKKIEEASQAFDEAKSSLEQTNSALEENEKRIRELNELPSRTYVEDEELAKLKEATAELEAQKELNEQKEASSAESLYALQEKKINSLGDFDSDYASTTFKAEIEKQQQNLSELQKIKSKINSELAQSRGYYSETLKLYPDIDKQIRAVQEEIVRLQRIKPTEVSGFNDQVKAYVSLTEQINNTTDAQERLDLISKRSELFTQENGLSDNLQLLQDQLGLIEKMSDESIEAVFGTKEAWKKRKQEIQQQYDEIYKILFPESYKSTKWKEVLGMDEFEGATEKLQEWVNAGLSEEEVLKKLKEVYPKLIDKLKEFGIEEDEIIDQFKEQETATTDATKSFEDLKEKLQSVKEAYEVLNSAIDEYNSNGSISYDTWEDLIALEDKFLSALVDENGQIKANNKALQDLMASKIEDITLTRMETYVKNLVTAAANGTLNQTLLLSDSIESNTNVRLENIMATIASNAALMQNREQILKTLSAMAQLTSSISLGSDSTKDAKDATEDWEKVLDYANTILDEQIEKLEAEQEALEKLTEEKIKAHEAEIKRLEEEKEALEEKNEEKNKELELEELERNLQKAKQRTMRVYRADLDTWVWEQDPEALQEAQQELDDFYTEQQIENIEDLIEAEEKKIEKLEENLDKETETYEERIKAIKDYKGEWNKVKTEHEKAQNEIIAKAKLGANAEKEILMGIDGKGGRLKVLNDFKTGYAKALDEVAKKTEESAGRINAAIGSFNLEKMKKMLNEMNLAGKTEKDFTYDARNRGTVIETGASGEKFMKIGTNQWVKMSDVKHLGGSGYQIKSGTQMYITPYASGAKSAKSGLANVDEKGDELIIPKQGRYRMMEYGDTVVPHNLSQRLFDVASNPLRFITNALNSVKSPNLITSSNQTSNQSIIHIGTVELPSVTNGENFIKQLQLIAANR